MSNFPSRTDIVTAMRNPQISYKAAELIDGAVIQCGSRIIQYSGGYSSVFPFNSKRNGKVAIRLWIADIGDAKRRSLEISNYLNNLKSEYFAGFKYLENAILINGSLHAVIIMDWIDGSTLKEYINSNISNSTKMLELASKFREMVAYFHDQNIAHGDLQHGNILVKDDGALVAIDYDSMYIKPLEGMVDTIKGLEGYQHPNRKSNKYIHSKLDCFSELVIYLSLLIYADNPTLWQQYYATEDLLFSKDDFSNPDSSSLINNLLSSPNTKIAELTRALKDELSATDILMLSPLEDFLIDRRKVSQEAIFNKWDNQPNPPKRKEVVIPKKSSIIDKF